MLASSSSGALRTSSSTRGLELWDSTVTRATLVPSLESKMTFPPPPHPLWTPLSTELPDQIHNQSFGRSVWRFSAALSCGGGGEAITVTARADLQITLMGSCHGGMRLMSRSSILESWNLNRPTARDRRAPGETLVSPEVRLLSHAL